MTTIETDYLVVGAGAAGMAFTDALVAASEADVVIVDRQHAPGGHWNHAYPFVRLHQPSAFYGVNSRPLGNDTIDASGPNAGFYERATGAEIRDYFRHVLDDHLLPSGQVRFVGGGDYAGDWASEHVVRSRLTGRATTVRVRRSIVDTTYLECSVPAFHTPTYTVDADAWTIRVGDLPDLAETPRGYTILGAGKTAMDACCWLLDNGVDPDAIRWVRPRDAWLLDRSYFQPLEQVATFVEGMSLNVEALAESASVTELLRRVEATGMFVRLDPGVEPTMLRGAIASVGERDALRNIERVVRLGRVRHIGADRIVLADGGIPTSRHELHVDCTAYGLGSRPLRPTFEPGRITIQAAGQTTPMAALVAYVEATRDDDADKNRLCPPSPTPSSPTDWVAMTVDILTRISAHASEPDLLAWRERSRLNLLRGMAARMTDHRMQTAMARWMRNQDLALENADRLLRSATAAPAVGGGAR